MKVTAVSDAKREDVVLEIGALREWHRELHDELRTPVDFDPLWLAACAEVTPRDYLRQGMVVAANDERRKATAIVRRLHAEASLRTPLSLFATLRPAKVRWSFAQ
jgi:hypothetical protein